jgi:hypothetical protein
VQPTGGLTQWRGPSGHPLVPLGRCSPDVN